jgi:GMP synthase (glutamine-hydrolysing)
MDTTIALLDASLGDTPAERNVRREVDADVDAFKLSEGRFPPSVSASDWTYDGVIVSGSQTSVYDDHDWIHEATEWARRAHVEDVPMLGLCWGHQFLAQALGGRVVDTRGYELGYRQVTRVGEDPLFADVPRTFTAFETHADRVAELPPGAVTLARNDHGLQAFRVGTAYGVQFHPEYDRETAEWVTRGKDLSDDRIESVLAGITDETVRRADAAKRVFDNFLSIVATHQPVQGDVRPRRAPGRDRASAPVDRAGDRDSDRDR